MSGAVHGAAPGPEPASAAAARPVAAADQGSSGEPLLTIDDLRVDFRSGGRTLRAVDGISLEVRPGEILGIVGESGCGKTVTGLSVLRLLPRTARASGRIAWRGQDLLTLSERELRAIRGRRISMIFQDPSSSLNPVFTVRSQLRRVITEHLGLSRREAAAKAAQTLTAVGLGDVDRILAAYPHQLSGGQKQRVMIAMALSCEPDLLIADEPTTALDVTIQAQILTLLRDLQHRLDIAVVLITHDLGVVAQVCDRVAVLYAGRVVETGPTRVFAAPDHPYTRGLRAALPEPGVRRGELTPIAGTVPADPGAVTGCAFAPRCPDAFDRCLVSAPALTALPDEHGADHRSACHLAQTGVAR
ncbi:MAG TPA: ABC transporter ATP-binding protein [Streptosporangiaceae bacterium]|nr:ABC transporter ATP-binding protein [Streptosporangiaceae bacterium]